MPFAKIAVVGARCPVTLALARALAARLGGVVRELRLVDVGPGDLRTLTAACRAVAHPAGFGVTEHTSLDEALAGVDVVVNLAEPGGLAARALDERVPVEADLPGHATAGPGGFLLALRSVPAALELAAAMARLAPEALLVNAARPAGLVTQALTLGSRRPVIGVSGGPEADARALARTLGLPRAALAWRVLGLDEAAWYGPVTAAGEPLRLPDPLHLPADLGPLARLEVEIAATVARGLTARWLGGPAALHVRPGPFVAEARSSGTRAAAVAAEHTRFWSDLDAWNPDGGSPPRPLRATPGVGDLLGDLLAALAGRGPATLPLLVPNHGLAPELAADTVVLADLQVDGTGLHRSPAPTLPAVGPSLPALERYQRAAALAAADQAPDAVVEALAQSPLVGTPARARDLLERARVAYEGAIPLLDHLAVPEAPEVP